MPVGRALAVVCATAALVAGCGDSDDGYTTETKTVAVRACNPAGPADPDRESLCECFYEGVRKEVPYEEYVQLNEDLLNDPDDVPEWVLDVIVRCETDPDGSVGGTDNPFVRS